MKNNSENIGACSCVILSFNHPEWTERAILAALNFHPAEHLYLVHNGSEPKWICQHKAKFPRIQHLIIETNRGFTGGTNFALQHLFQLYEWVFFQTNDCLVLNRLMPPTREGFFAPLIYKRNTGKIDSMGGLFWPHKTKLKHCLTESEFRLKPLFAKTYIPGTAFWMHRTVFQKVGLFDESLHTYWEDVDYSQRAHKLKINIDIDRNTQLIHGVGKTCHKDPFYTKYLFQRNKVSISKKYTPIYLKHLLYFNLIAFKIRNRLKKPLRSSQNIN
jgi:GT2 family glycosyltransferase